MYISFIHTHSYTCLSVCLWGVCVCVCACVRAECSCISRSSIPIHIRVCRCIPIHTRVCLPWFLLHGWVFVCVYVHACARNARVYLVHPYPFIYVFVDTYHSYACLSIHTHSYTCLSIHTHSYIRVCLLSIPIRVCRCIPIHIRVFSVGVMFCARVGVVFSIR